MDELLTLSACEVVGLLKTKKVSPSELLDVLAARIAQTDGVINALPTLCFDRARKRSKNNYGETLLAGLPVAIKDLSDVSGVRTTFGSLIYKDNISEKSDLLVEHLEAAGGIVYAKSNTPEFGTGGNTYNRVFGMTRNPWNTEMSAAGSSGGAAAALAAGMAWLAQGSDMGGSLRNPASFCGVVGLRPSVGRVAATPVDKIIDTLSVSGPMARNVRDLALMLDAMSGHENADPLSLPAPAVSFLDCADSPRLPETIAYSADLGITPVDPAVRKIFDETICKIAETGGRMVQAHPDFFGLQEIFHVLRAHSYASRLGNLLDRHGDKLNPNVAWNIEQGLKLEVKDIDHAERQRVLLAARVQRFFSRYPLLLTPAAIVPPYPAARDHVASCDGHQFDNYYQWLSIGYAFTVGLCPALSLPAGLTDDGLPVGIQAAGKTYSEPSIISAAAELENILQTTADTPIDPVVPGDGERAPDG